jgi:hypothetical protein
MIDRRENETAKFRQSRTNADDPVSAGGSSSAPNKI